MTTLFKIRTSDDGTHVVVHFWSSKGLSMTYAKNGELVFSQEEWRDFKDLLKRSDRLTFEKSIMEK